MNGLNRGAATAFCLNIIVVKQSRDLNAKTTAKHRTDPRNEDQALFSKKANSLIYCLIRMNPEYRQVLSVQLIA
jgi:hypothetical protein